MMSQLNICVGVPMCVPLIFCVSKSSPIYTQCMYRVFPQYVMSTVTLCLKELEEHMVIHTTIKTILWEN